MVAKTFMSCPYCRDLFSCRVGFHGRKHCSKPACRKKHGDATAPEWFGYRHVDGGLHLKRYSRVAFDDAKESDFVDEVFGPFKASNRVKAAEKLAKLVMGVSGA